MSHAGFRRLRTSVNTSMCKQVYTTLWWLRSTPTALASLSCIETAPVSQRTPPGQRPKLRTAGTSGETPQSAIKSQ
ncbi:hypothetical protein T05_6538 [Trichinella murrelli]|uniref:Uncharacterized protein n=1 Tax=Trichinella murrelli TaxID=144512 RepID=A0A0V0U580_9BILA|nr:hypothetical protein T05_6538 [Trichinella murrelli]